MKKARIVLSAVALFALVGGALAFKATRGAGNLYSYTTTSSTVIAGTTYYFCTLPDFVRTNAAVNPISTYYTSKTTIGAVTGLCTVPTITRGIFVE